MFNFIEPATCNNEHVANDAFTIVSVCATINMWPRMPLLQSESVAAPDHHGVDIAGVFVFRGNERPTSLSLWASF